MTSTAPFSYSHVFNLSDCSLVEVMTELQTTNAFTLTFLSDSAEQLTAEKNATYVKFEDFSNKEESFGRRLVIFKSNADGSSVGAYFEWLALFQIHSVIKELGAEVIARIVKPLASLPGAVEFFIPEDCDIEKSINVIANEHCLEAVFINSDSKVPGLKTPGLKAPTIKKPGLLVMDMDSTAIQIECIDEIAKLAGVGEQVAAVTASAMRGELDFAESLHARVATLKGAPQSVIADVAGNLPLMPGLETLVLCLKQHHWKIAIVSGGFTAMTEALKEQLGLDITLANNLDIKDAKLSGTVSGKVIDAQAKADAVLSLSKQFNIPMSQTIAMGDGANDLKMMAVASLGVAFHAKPLVCEQADVSVRQGGLDQLLYLIG